MTMNHLKSFTSERSYLAVLRALLPRGRDRPAAERTDVLEPAKLPGQNDLEVYGMAFLIALFHVLWCGEALGSVWLALPAGLVLLHVSAILSAVLGGWLHRRYADPGDQAYHWPQCLHWTAILAMAGVAIAAPFPLTRWLAWPLACLLGINLIAWFALRRWLPLGVALVWHLAALGLAFVSGPGPAFLSLVPLHLLIVFDTLYPHSRIFSRALRSFSTEAKEVWLTIDDGPAEDTREILALLDRHGAKATFFLVGTRTEERPQDLEAIVAGGHQIANHSHTHPAVSFWIYPWRRLQREIGTAQDLLEKRTGRRSRLFRSPVGFANPLLQPLLDQAHLTLVGWSARGFDGVGHDVEGALHRLKRQIRPGAIILLHQGRSMNLPLLQALLEWLDEEGIRCVLPNLFENESARL